MADGANPKPKSKPIPEWLNSPLWSALPPPLAAAAAARRRSPPRAPSPPPPPPPDPSPPQPPIRSDPDDDDEAEDDESAAAAAASSSRSHLLGEFKIALGKKVVDLAELRRLACQGVPDVAGVRPVLWKVSKIFANSSNW